MGRADASISHFEAVDQTALAPLHYTTYGIKTPYMALCIDANTRAHEAQPTSTPREVPTGTKAADDGRAAALLARLSTLKETH